MITYTQMLIANLLKDATSKLSDGDNLIGDVLGVGTGLTMAGRLRKKW